MTFAHEMSLMMRRGEEGSEYIEILSYLTQ